MQFMAVTADERDFVIVVNEEDDNNTIREWIAESLFYDEKEIKLGKRTETCPSLIRQLGLMHFDILELRDESEILDS